MPALLGYLSSCPLGYECRLFDAQDLPERWPWSSGRVFPPFVRFIALLLVRCPQIWLYFAFLGRFWRVLWSLCGFVLVACFAWLVGLLCA